MAKKVKELVTDVEESPAEAILDEAKPQRLTEIEGIAATKKLKSEIRKLDSNLPFLDFSAFIKEHSDKVLFGKLAGYFDEACRLLGSTSLEVTASCKLYQIKPEDGLETRCMTGIPDTKVVKGGKMSEPFPDGLELKLFSKDRKKVCSVKAFIRHGLIVTWFNQTLTVG